jgi:dethiobiotin synthetase
MSYFVTGTDTGVGKTLVGCALLRCFAKRGKRVAGFKPIAAGCDAYGHNGDALRLREASTTELSYEQVNPYCFREGIAPNIAAMRDHVTIDCSFIAKFYRDLASKADVVIAEGAGGLLVPLNSHQDGADLVAELGLPLILVVGMRLGCLNHALLTLGAISSRTLTLAGWVANILDGQMPALQENIEALRHRIPAPMLGVIPHMKTPDIHVAAEAIDVNLLDDRRSFVTQ